LPGVTCVIGNSHKHQLAEIALRDDSFARDHEASKLTGMELASVAEFRGGRGLHGASGTPKSDFGWRSASSAAKNSASLDGA